MTTTTTARALARLLTDGLGRTPAEVDRLATALAATGVDFDLADFTVDGMVNDADSDAAVAVYDALVAAGLE